MRREPHPADQASSERGRRADEAREHIAEISKILALALIRLRPRQSSEVFERVRDCSLDCLGEQSGDANGLERPEGIDGTASERPNAAQEERNV